MKRFLTLMLLSLAFYVSAFASELRADINCDGRVDLADFSIMASEWLATGSSSYYLSWVNGFDYTYFDTDASFKVGSGNFSMWLWLRLAPNMTGANSILSADGSSKSYGLAHYLQGKASFMMFDGTNDLTVRSEATGLLNTGNWVLLLATVDRASATGAKLYVNNILVATGDPTSIGNLDEEDTKLYISALNYLDRDEFGIYKGILTTDQRNTIYASGSGHKITDAFFASIDGFHSNCDDGTNPLTGRKHINNVHTSLNATMGDALGWQSGGVGISGCKCGDN